VQDGHHLVLRELTDAAVVMLAHEPAEKFLVIGHLLPPDAICQTGRDQSVTRLLRYVLGTWSSE
jgi:hypothetical protein